MDRERMQKFIGNTSLTIVDAMERIGTNAKGILFLVDHDDCLAGCITDGDIRRWLLKAGDLKATVDKAMMSSPKYLFIDEKYKAEKIMEQEKITAIPLLNTAKKIIDIVLLSELKQIAVHGRNDSLSGVPTIIMAGGKGTRLYPYTKILPKPLIPIGETPIVERVLNCFVDYGIEKFYMTVNYKKGMIKSYFSELNTNYTITYVEETIPLGTGGSIKLITEKFDQSLFVTNCDALILADYSDIYNYHIKSGNSITMVSALKNTMVPYGVLHTGNNGELINIEEKPKLSYFINTGMYVIKPETIELIPKDTLFHMTHLVESVMKSGGQVGTYPVSEDSFLDMGEFGEMHRMEEKLHIVSD